MVQKGRYSVLCRGLGGQLRLPSSSIAQAIEAAVAAAAFSDLQPLAIEDADGLVLLAGASLSRRLERSIAEARAQA